MLTRRAFLKTTATASAVSATLASQATSAALHSIRQDTGTTPLLVFSDGDQGQTAQFSAALSSEKIAEQSSPRLASSLHSRIHKDVADQIREVDDFCRSTPQGVLIGLTRDSDFFILAHTAAQHGFELHYKGVHDFRGQEMRHEINAPQGIASALAKTLQQAQHQWPQQLANVTPTIIEAQGSLRTEEVQATLEYRSDDPGYLVSWILKAGY